MTKLVQKTENYVKQLLNKKLSPKFLYHSYHHTIRVVEKAKEMLKSITVTEAEAEALLLAAWFHDIGYTISSDEHEKHSIALATTFLKIENATPKLIEQVTQLIHVTTIDVQPQTLLEQMICDADCAHFSSKNYDTISELLRKEWELLQNKTYTESEWLQENIDLFTKKHQYHTPYAIENWQIGKDKNLIQLLKKQKKSKTERKKEKKQNKQLKLKQEKAATPERGIETMFRVTLKNHMELSAIADTKANILLSVNAIILSLALANLIPKLDNPSNEYLIVPSAIFIVMSVISIIFAILSTRPNVTGGEFTRQEIKNKKVNLLFFGNFHKMPLEEYTWGIREVMKDKDYLYDSMIKDLYFLGKVLHRKYKLLRLTYAIFMTGIIVSVLSFTIAFWINV